MPESTPPPLPPGIESAILRALDGPSELAEEQIASIVAANPRDASNIQHFARWLKRSGNASAPPPSTMSPSVIDSLDSIERPRVRLTNIGDDDESANQDSEGSASESRCKYRLFGELGRGGIGVVYRGEDTDLGRKVAVKFLHERFNNQPAILNRFVEEAQIGAQLQHPGIVPVYDLGESNGKPFFVMKLVKGEPLSLLLSRRTSKGDNLQRFLTLFEQVCRTIEYAHARSVIHRDLKPENILTGSFGEVQVVDWGMAKVLGDHGQRSPELREEASALSLIETVRSKDESSVSVAGSILGTPAYMAPEQAIGDVERVDQRTDVFALGAVLCELLTGSPPYVSEHNEPDQRLKEIVMMAARAKLDPARKRLAESGLDQELVALAEQCMSPSPAMRPNHAGDVAQAVAKYLAAIAQRAEQAKMEAQAAKQRQTWLAAVAATFVIGFGTALFFWSSAKDLASSERVAKQNAVQLAEDKTLLADANAQLADDESKARADAERNLSRFTELKNVVLLRNAKQGEEKLYPAWPENAEAMRKWLEEDARPLVAAIPDIERSLQEVKERAVELSAEEQLATRPDRSQAAALERAEKILAAHELATRIRQGETLTLPEFDDETRTRQLGELNALVWERVSPSDKERKVVGEEAYALALALHLTSRTASEAPELLASHTDSLAWAHHQVGQDDKAKLASARATELAPTDKKSEFTQYSKTLLTAIESATGSASLKRTQDLSDRIVDLKAAIDQMRPWKFETVEDTFLYETLADLLQRLRRFKRTTMSDVEYRRDWALKMMERCHTRYADDWNRARRAITRADDKSASKLYASTPDFELKPQADLIPIGMNPVTKLWEFYHLASAKNPDQPPPKHDANGKLGVSEATGIVFVLVPGGRRWLGAEKLDEEKPDETAVNVDPGALPDETPYEVTLDPYFIARHELTQGQWQRMSGGHRPSHYGPGWKEGETVKAVDLTHPVELVTWVDCTDLLKEYGLLLPTEAQWEYAARAGTDTPWWTGKDRDSLIRNGLAANLADQCAKRSGAFWSGIDKWETLEDGHMVHASVDAFRPNPWGLYHVHGNVWEWCRDGYGETPQPRDGDGLRLVQENLGHPHRGGSFVDAVEYARSAYRGGNVSTFRGHDVGLRPLRALIN